MAKEVASIDKILERLEAVERSLIESRAQNAILKRQMAQEAQRQKDDPTYRAELTSKILENSRKMNPGKYHWAVQVPGYFKDVTFNCDTEDPVLAAALYEQLFRTVFLRDQPLTRDNHTIRLLGRWVNDKLQVGHLNDKGKYVFAADEELAHVPVMS